MLFHGDRDSMIVKYNFRSSIAGVEDCFEVDGENLLQSIVTCDSRLTFSLVNWGSQYLPSDV